MELVDFLRQTQEQVRAEIDDRLEASGAMLYPFKGGVFSEIVTQHMHEIGMTAEPFSCTFQSVCGYAVSEDATELDLFVSLYQGGNELVSIPDVETMRAAEQCLRILSDCASGVLTDIEEKDEAYPLVLTIKECYATLDQIRIFVLTDRVAKSKNFKARQVRGKTIKLEVMDIERLHRHWSEGKPRDELIANFQELCGGPLPCVYVPGELADYDYALAAIPGEALNFMYEKFGARLLEANVRSFLSASVKVNKGIRDTLRQDPERFMAYNNGVVIVADEASVVASAEGGFSLAWLKGMQIVNGGQTTASIYFTKKKNPEIKLGRVRVPTKIIILRSDDSAREEGLISDISKFANTQNAVKASDLSANKPFHIEIEKLALSTYCPDGIGRWFYERAAGSYNVMLTREGTTPTRLKLAKESIPATRKIGKTDLAKYLNAWAKRPDLVSLGSQKNFDKFMAGLPLTAEGLVQLPDLLFYKRLIAKAILFKRTSSLVRPMFEAAQANVATYVISLVSERLGEKLDLEKIWLKQDISAQLRTQLHCWAKEMHVQLQRTAKGRSIAEWAKKSECWEQIKHASFSNPLEGIPEIQGDTL